MINHSAGDLRALLSARQPLYAAADHTVETTGASVKNVVDEIYGRVKSSS